MFLKKARFFVSTLRRPSTSSRYHTRRNVHKTTCSCSRKTWRNGSASERPHHSPRKSDGRPEALSFDAILKGQWQAPRGRQRRRRRVVVAPLTPLDQSCSRDSCIGSTILRSSGHLLRHKRRRSISMPLLNIKQTRSSFPFLRILLSYEIFLRVRSYLRRRPRLHKVSRYPAPIAFA